MSFAETAEGSRCAQCDSIWIICKIVDGASGDFRLLQGPETRLHLVVPLLDAAAEDNILVPTRGAQTCLVNFLSISVQEASGAPIEGARGALGLGVNCLLPALHNIHTSSQAALAVSYHARQKNCREARPGGRWCQCQSHICGLPVYARTRQKAPGLQVELDKQLVTTCIRIPGSCVRAFLAFLGPS